MTFELQVMLLNGDAWFSRIILLQGSLGSGRLKHRPLGQVWEGRREGARVVGTSAGLREGVEE